VERLQEGTKENQKKNEINIKSMKTELGCVETRGVRYEAEEGKRVAALGSKKSSKFRHFIWQNTSGFGYFGVLQWQKKLNEKTVWGKQGTLNFRALCRFFNLQRQGEQFLS